MADGGAQSNEERQLRVLQLQRMLNLIVHASRCQSSSCEYPNCGKLKGLFRHGIRCQIRASGGCLLCKKMWCLLQIHARVCKDSDSECRVPHCRALKEHLARVHQLADARRRNELMEIIRETVAGAANGDEEMVRGNLNVLEIYINNYL